MEQTVLSFSEQTKQVYVRLSQGESAENIAKDLDITRGTIYVYKERVQKALRKKIRHFDSELG